MIDVGKGSLKGMGSVMLNHDQRNPQSVNVMQMGHNRSSRRDRPRPSQVKC
jgi:hypothetical protein